MADENDEMTDDELQQLLNQLDENDGFVADAMEAEAEPKNGKPKEPQFAKPEVTLQPADDLVAKDARKFDDTRDLTQAEEEVPVGSIQIQKYLDRLDDVTAEVLSGYRSDRQETQEVIDLCKKAIDDAKKLSTPPGRMWVDGLVKAVEIKAGISTNAIKMIEANAKMLAATKAGTVLNQQINLMGDQELDSLLSEELGSEDQY
jgi:hypothetical protein